MELPKTLQPFADMIDKYNTDHEDGRLQHWIELKPGLIDLESECHGIHESSLARVARRFRKFVVPCSPANCTDECWRRHA